MNYLLLMAGGVGNRVGANIPKQFINVLGKPIIAYTLQVFQENNNIDAILLVCVRGYQETLSSIVTENNITKVFKIVEGGKDYEHSIMNGISSLDGIAKPDDVVQIHWAASPFITHEIINDNILVCKQKGNAISACKPYVLYAKKNGDHATEVIDRDSFLCMSAPHAFLYKNIVEMYKLANEHKLFDYIEPHTTNIMAALHIPIYFSFGNQTNIKITTKEDVDLFKGYLLMKQCKD